MKLFEAPRTIVSHNNMGDFFKSLNFNYFNNTTSTNVADEGVNGGGGSVSGATVNTGSLDNDYVGQFVEIGEQKLRTKCVIAEGIKENIARAIKINRM